MYHYSLRTRVKHIATRNPLTRPPSLMNWLNVSAIIHPMLILIPSATLLNMLLCNFDGRTISVGVFPIAVAVVNIPAVLMEFVALFFHMSPMGFEPIYSMPYAWGFTSLEICYLPFFFVSNLKGSPHNKFVDNE